MTFVFEMGTYGCMYCVCITYSSTTSSVGSDAKEIAAMNNYCGIGLDAKITYEFHTRREENPGQYT